MKGVIFIAIVFSGFSLTAFRGISSENLKTENNLLGSYVNDTSHLQSTIVQVIPNGPNSILILNRGSSHNVNVGDSGILSGHRDMKFIIMEVFPARSKAVFIPEIQASKISTSKAVIYITKK